jgi:hypothetical protein
MNNHRRVPVVGPVVVPVVVRVVVPVVVPSSAHWTATPLAG